MRKNVLVMLSAIVGFSLIGAPIKSGIGARGTSSINETEVLPYDAVVEYIQTRGGQWIDTGYVPKTFPNIELRGSCPYATTLRFGMNSPLTGICIDVKNHNDNDGGIDWYYWTVEVKGVNTKYESHKEFRLYTDGNRFVCGAYRTDPCPNDFSNNNQSIFLNRIWWGNRNSSAGTKIKWFKVWECESLVMDLVSVRFTTPSGETDGGMYDRVSGRLLKNQGTGTFIVGPDVVEE